ncbi:GNAT family N-acetyltransferase [Tenuibacillus multivorans]|uniref:Acetyltransferase (GNAT) family protein n=1 Tax=Tenuibacillus multivorans TaxID=237069 RepID=A0A1H0A1B4_9BACI|nr:GNAT family N-acetyltransferase [Tenuibacillus multivorans]GEL78354.1 N-acetyltransferase [Tenuibacillus multivorans]SDN27187.1 Acetyltransferase (GNAT) family protein [Tenuibacillus multivorans]
MILQFDQDVFKIRQAMEKDLDSVLQLLRQAAIWLQSKGTDQWSYYISDLEGEKPEVLESIKNNSTYILEKEEEVIASITLEEHPIEWDRLVWEEKANEPGMVYLHRIVVNREYAGKDIGIQLIDWAKDFVQEKGKKCIRFDCLASNQGLNDYYQRKYERNAIVTVYGGQHSRYEIIV